MTVRLSQWSPGYWEAKERFLDSIENLGTRRNYSIILHRFLATVTSPEMATSEDVAKFLHTPCLPGSRNAGANCQPGTRNVRLACLRRFYDFSSKYRVIGDDGKPHKLFTDLNPCDAFRNLATSPKGKGMSVEQVEAFFRAISESDASPQMKLRDRSLFGFLLYQCRRVAEACSLSIGDIVQETISDENGARLAWVYKFVPLKSKAAQEDLAELSVDVKRMIDDYLATRAHLKPDMPLWGQIGSRNGGLPVDPYAHLTPDAVRARMKHYLKIAALPLDWAPHIFRHTSTQIRYRSGATLLQLRHVLRHRSIETTRVYLEHLNSASDSSLTKLSEQFSALR
jgi:site-specific recombinase XerD